MLSKARQDMYEDDSENGESFSNESTNFLGRASAAKNAGSPRVNPWICSNILLAICLLLSFLAHYPGQKTENYESGFATDMQPARASIELEEVRFWGGIKADDNGTFYMHFDPDQKVRYVGKPNREMDEAWNRLTGNFIPLTQSESTSVRGEISEHNGAYLAATTVQHSLHCLNYLRQAIYDDYYPSIHLIRPHIPEYWLHVDHCVENLRQVLQCGGDLTPVPKVWSESAAQLMANIESVHTCRNFDKILQWTETR